MIKAKTTRRLYQRYMKVKLQLLLRANSEGKILPAEMTDSGVAADYTPLSTNMELEDLTLPRDKFSRLRYFFVVRPHCTFFLLLDLALIGIFSVWLKLTEEGGVSILFFPFGIPIIGMVAVFSAFPGGNTSKNILVSANADTYELQADTRNTLSFLGEVIMFRPGLDENKWDLIAARLNRIFHRSKKSITPYFFYDGAHCHSYFESYYVNRSTSTVTNANRSETANIVQPMLDEAVKVYKESLEEHWGQYRAQISDISEQNNVSKD